MRTLQVISPRRTPSRRRFVKTTAGFYNAFSRGLLRRAGDVCRRREAKKLA